MLSLTYVSSASELLEPARLSEMLTDWRPRNTSLGLTGCLLYSEGNIIQTLEGPAAAVDAMYGTILDDPRHRGVLMLLREPAVERAFPDWSMGFRHLSPEEVSTVEGFNPFLEQPAGAEMPGPATSAHHLMKVFKDNMR